MTVDLLAVLANGDGGDGATGPTTDCSIVPTETIYTPIA